MELNFDSDLLQILDANEIIILSIIKEFKTINKVQLLEIYSKISANKLDKIIRNLIKNKYIFYGKNYTLKIYSGEVLEDFPSKIGRLPFQKLPSIESVGLNNIDKFKNLSIYKDILKNKNKTEEEKEKEKEKDKFVEQISNENASNKTGYKVYDLDTILKIVDPEVPAEYVANLFKHFESQSFKSSGTLITNLKTRIELYYKKNWYQNFKTKTKDEANTTNTNFEQRLTNIKLRNDKLRAYGLVNEAGDEVGVIKRN